MTAAHLLSSTFPSSAHKPVDDRATLLSAGISDRDTIVARITAAIASDNGVAMLQLAKELGSYGKSTTSRSNRTNKKKTLETARTEWWASVGIDPIKFYALALLCFLFFGRTRGWDKSVDAALMVLRPDLPSRPGILPAARSIPELFSRPKGPKARGLDLKRKAIARKLKSAVAYRNGPLAPEFRRLEVSLRDELWKNLPK